jgi:hypothetical protein
MQEAQQVDLQIALRGKIGVAAFTGEDVVTSAVPEQSGFAESGSGGDDRLIADGASSNAVQRDEVAGGESAHAPGAGFEVVYKPGRRQMNLFGEVRLLDDPRQVRGFDTAVAHRTGDSEAGYIRTGGGAFQKLFDDLAELVMLAAGKDALGNQVKMPVLGLKIGQPGVGSPDVAGQNHFSKFLQRRPSRSSSSSASFGPQLPEA